MKNANKLSFKHACKRIAAYAGWSHTAPAVGKAVRPLAGRAFGSVAELAAFLEEN